MAVAASLMGASLPAPFASGLGDFASRLAEQTGEQVRIDRSDRAGGPGMLDLGWPDETLLSIEIIEPEPSARMAQVRTGRARWVAGLAALAWLLLALGGSGAGIGQAAVALAAAGWIVPVEVVVSGEAAASPALAKILDLPFGGGGAAGEGAPGGLAVGRLLLIAACSIPAAVLLAPRARSGGLPVAHHAAGGRGASLCRCKGWSREPIHSSSEPATPPGSSCKWPPPC